MVYPVSSSRPPPAENKRQAVAVHDGCGDALVDEVWCVLPGQVAPVPIELQLLGEVLSLSASPNELHDGVELLVAATLLLLHAAGPHHQG